MLDPGIIGKRLKTIRERRGKTQKDVARDLNIKANTYSNYESGRRYPRADFLMELCRYFDVEPNYIYGISPIPFSFDYSKSSEEAELERRGVEEAMETLGRYIGKTFR
ncbi:MAG TPA: helix-turn-helix transcriptional regulator [Bacillota bacterium]|nr:helix-turn-helix transcriptional regulator [Bacillota bacterium]